MSEVLTPDQITGYDKNGYIVLENQIPSDWLGKIPSEIARFEIEAAGIVASNDRFDREDSPTSENPRLKNIPVCIPQPQPGVSISIYEIQKGMKKRAFDTAK